MTNQRSASSQEKIQQAERFTQLFGVSKDELRRRGIDPGVYARQNVGRALGDRSKWDLVLPESDQLRLLWTRWGWRGFVAMFAGYGFLVLSRVHGLLHVVGLAGALAMLAVSGIAGGLMFRYRLRYRRAMGATTVVNESLRADVSPHSSPTGSASSST